MTLWLEASQCKSPAYQFWWPYALWHGDVMNLVCHVISQDYVIKRPGHCMDKSPPMKGALLQSFVVIATLVVEMYF